MAGHRRQQTWIVLALLAGAESTSVTAGTEGPPGDDAVRALVQRAIRNQERNDLGLPEFEHRERSSASCQGRTDKVSLYRMVPTGLETGRVLLERDGRKVEASRYRNDLRNVARRLEDIVVRDPDSNRGKADGATYRGSGLLAELDPAFTYRWLRREVIGGRAMVVLGLQPKPGYVPRGRIGRALPHVTATVWIDEEDEQFARLEADVFEDIVIAGFLGRIDRGGHVSLRQAPVGDGLWFVAGTSLELSGRKLLFGFVERRQVECSSYRRVGPPPAVLTMVRAELDDPTPAANVSSAVARLEPVARCVAPATSTAPTAVAEQRQ